jgi:drug/metabolite transporter (DMT)-like permease
LAVVPDQDSTKIWSSVGLAIVLSLLALVLFDFMGLIIKRLSPVYSAAELSAYRNFFGLIPSVIALWTSKSWHQSGRTLRIRQWRLACLRGVIVSLAQLMFYLSLGTLPFASATTITYSGALFMVAFAVPLLGERVGAIRWSATLIGFVGVIMVMGPGRETFSWDTLLPLGAAALYSLTGVTSKLFDDEVSTPIINLYSAVFAALASIALALYWGGFSAITNPMDWVWIIAMGVFGGGAVLLLIVSYRMTEPSNLAPFSYFGIPFAFLFGWIFFEETPIDDLFPGALLIIAGGLLIVLRERRLARGRINKLIL